MSGRIIVRREVPDDIQQILRPLNGHSREFAERFAARVDPTLTYLRDFPGVGSPKEYQRPSHADIRTWPIICFPHHLVCYRVRPRAIEVVGIIHGARHLEALLAERL